MRFTDLWIALPALPFLAVAVSIGTVDLGPFGDARPGRPARDHPAALAASCGVRSHGWCAARRCRCASASSSTPARAIGASNPRIITATRDAELPRTDHRERDARGRGGDPGGEHAVVPRVRHPAAHAELGQPARRTRSATSRTSGGSPCSRGWRSSSPCSRSTSWVTACATRSIRVDRCARDRRPRGRRPAVSSSADRRRRGAARCEACRSRSRPARRVAIVGESGSGKTVTALAIMGLIDPPGRIVAGDVRFDGRCRSAA